MKPSEQMIAEQRQRAEARAYELWQIRLAARTNNTGSHYHPDKIRAQIADLRRLLHDAEQ